MASTPAAVGADPPPSAASSSATTSSAPEQNLGTTEKLLLGGELFPIPGALFADEQIFRAVLSPSAFWSLSQASREHLKCFLPPMAIAAAPSTSASSASTADQQQQQQEQLDELLVNTAFTRNNNFCFGNPLSKFYTRIRNGYFSSPEQVQLRDHRRVMYDHYIRHYQMNLLKKLLVNRHVILEQATTQLSLFDDHIHINPRTFVSARKLDKHRNVKHRAQRRAHKMLNDCRKKAGQEPGHSSDDSATEGDDVQHRFALELAPNARSTLYSPRFSAADLDLYQPLGPRPVAELYREYARLRETEPDCPSLDISDITLEEVYERAGLSFQAERNFSRNSAAVVMRQKQQQQQQEWNPPKSN